MVDLRSRCVVQGLFPSIFDALALRVEEWPARPDDLDRQHKLVVALRADPDVPSEHCDAIEREIGTIRYRPTEVAGACSSADLPCSFADASRAAVHIVRTFEASPQA